MMERASILAGKCYRDSRGTVYEVTAYDGENVHFVAHGSIDRSPASKSEGAEPWHRFLEDLQQEVQCPRS
ncbi:hypothetical protein [Reyranella sp.]|uniref:hypothetical protein n=1 Tax=Reyranella sp. TaxID=1929291 RepID=UPI003D0D3F75